MNKFLFIFLILPFIFSCATVNVEKRIKDSGTGPRRQSGGTYQIEFPAAYFEPEVIVVERPVFVPAETAQPSRPPAAGEQTVRASNSAGIIRPQDYSHAAIVYDYNQDWVYEVYAQPLRVCDISLQHGENAVEPPFVSDSERWIIGAGISYENGNHVQHIYIKPQSSGLEASLIINTDRRVYRIILRSFTNIHMPVIRWRYMPPCLTITSLPPRPLKANRMPAASIPGSFLSITELPTAFSKNLPGCPNLYSTTAAKLIYNSQGLFCRENSRRSLKTATIF